MRDKQIYTRVTQAVYDYLAEQAKNNGMSMGAAAALLLASCAADDVTIDTVSAVKR